MSPGHWEDIIYSITKYYIYISNIIPARDPKQCGGSGRIMSRMMMMMMMMMMPGDDDDDDDDVDDDDDDDNS